MNGWDIVILCVLALLVTGAVRSIVRAKRNGGSVCGGDCSRCGSSCAERTPKHG